MDKRAKQVLNVIVEKFKSGEIPEAIALASFPIPEIPSSNWSFTNRTLMFLAGTGDGRGFLQWKHANRWVKKGARAFYILVPCFKREMDDDILLLHKEPDTAFSSEQKDIFSFIRNQVGMAIENALLFKKTRSNNVELEEKVKQRTQKINAINEELVQVNQAKSNFLANMSHELRTPLTAIIGFSEVLYDKYFGPLNEKQEQYIKDIQESGKHLLSLINDIPDLSKVEAGKMELELAPVNVKDLIEDSLVMIKEKAMKHGISLDAQIPDEVSEIEIKADERKLKQVMFNLLSNAAKFTPDGGAIEVKAELEGEDITISVSDTGIGVDPEDQEKIFDEFYQVDGGKKDKTPGTGLGLPLSFRLLKMHGSDLRMESKGKNKGSRFFFSLPLRAEPPETPMPEIYEDETLPIYLERIISLSLRQNRIFSLCCFYPEGENLQEKISDVKKVLNKQIRTSDYLEMDNNKNLFLILKDTNYERAQDVCGRIVQRIESMIEGLEISYSIAVFPEDGKTPEELIEKALF